MPPDGLRLRETPGIDAATLDIDHPDVPWFAGIDDISITASRAGFTIGNRSPTDLSVLVTLMAKATGADEQQARELLMSVTSTEGRGRPLHVPPEGDAEAFARLWQDDIEVRRHGRTGWKATRSGIVVLPIPAAGSFLLPHDPVLPRGAVMVAAVAAAGVGLTDAVLRPVDRGPTASIGEMPEPRA